MPNIMSEKENVPRSLLFQGPSLAVMYRHKPPKSVHWELWLESVRDERTFCWYHKGPYVVKICLRARVIDADGNYYISTNLQADTVFAGNGGAYSSLLKEAVSNIVISVLANKT